MPKNYFENLKETILKILQEADQNQDEDDRSLTVAEICEKVNTTDEDGVMLVLGELENVDESVAQTTPKTVRRPNAEPVLLARYCLIKQ